MLLDIDKWLWVDLAKALPQVCVYCKSVGGENFLTESGCTCCTFDVYMAYLTLFFSPSRPPIWSKFILTSGIYSDHFKNTLHGIVFALVHERFSLLVKFRLTKGVCTGALSSHQRVQILPMTPWRHWKVLPSSPPIVLKKRILKIPELYLTVFQTFEMPVRDSLS